MYPPMRHESHVARQNLLTYLVFQLVARIQLSAWDKVRFHYIFTISQLWLTSHLRSTVVLLDTGTPGTSREIYIEDADDGTRTHNPSMMELELTTPRL